MGLSVDAPTTFSSANHTCAVSGPGLLSVYATFKCEGELTIGSGKKECGREGLEKEKLRKNNNKKGNEKQFRCEKRTIYFSRLASF
jgi:hypothetical protein